jgi:hypothetical protein
MLSGSWTTFRKQFSHLFYIFVYKHSVLQVLFFLDVQSCPQAYLHPDFFRFPCENHNFKSRLQNFHEEFPCVGNSP